MMHVLNSKKLTDKRIAQLQKQASVEIAKSQVAVTDVTKIKTSSNVRKKRISLLDKILNK